jgi:phosphatidate cytidylyltransferase
VNNFWQRIITGTVFVGVILSSIWWGPLTFQLLFFVVAMLSVHEFFGMISGENRSPNTMAGYLAAFITYGAISFPTQMQSILPGINPLTLLLPVFTLIFIAELYRKSTEPFTNIAFTVVGVLYVVLPFALLNTLATDAAGNYDRGILLGYFFLLWSSDSFAYVFGMLFGKTKLFERISPKKSWEGSIGGGLTTLGIAWLISTFQPGLSTIEWLIFAAIIIVAGTLGDLTESMLKRSLKVKDSGTLLPGHGGLLDRFDALFISVPLLWAYLSLVR